MYLSVFVLMLIVMGVFFAYTLNHPDVGFEFPLHMVYLFYAIYVVAMLSCFVMYLKSDEKENAQ